MLNALQPLVASTQNYELVNECEHLRATYSTMLRYMVQGVEDANATSIYAKLVQHAYSLADRANRMIRLQTKTNEKYTITWKYMRKDLSLDNILLSLETHCAALRQLREEPNKRESIQQHDLELHQKAHEDMLTAMFEYVWTSDLWHRSDYEKAQELLNSDDLSNDDKCVFTSAVMLSLMEMFDERKMMYLFDAYLSPTTTLNQRAIVGLILLLRTYDQRIAKFPELTARLSLYLDDPKFIRDAYRVMMQLQHSKITDTVSAKMRDDIIPTILKSTQFKQTKYGIEQIDEYLTQNGENPEWHKQLDEKAESKIHEIAELQMEGADVYMSTFTHMKGYSFFQTMAHWFTPYDPAHPALPTAQQDIANTPSLLSKILKVAPFCDSDKYSFCLMLDNIGGTGRDMLAQNLSSQLEREDMDDPFENMKDYRPKTIDISRNYIYDLYRFFQLYPYHPQFQNPFAKDTPTFTPLGTRCLAPLLQHTDEVVTLAEFLMRKGFYADAIALFETLQPKQREEDADIWQKTGFCHQKNGNLATAFQHYATAFQLKPTSQWTLKHLAQTAYQLQYFTEAEAYYDLLLDDDGDNLRYLIRKINCLMQSEQYDKAIPLLYKATYLDEDNEELQDELAWCHLLAGNTEKAKSTHPRLKKEAATQDAELEKKLLLHASCIMLVDGNMQTAYTLLHQARAFFLPQENGDRLFKKKFIDMARTLKTLGIDIRRSEMLYDAACIGLE